MKFHTKFPDSSRPGSRILPHLWSKVALPAAFSLCQWLLDVPTVPPTRTSPLPIEPTRVKLALPLPLLSTPTVTQTPAQDISSPVAPLLWGFLALTVFASMGASLAAYRIMETDTPPKPWPAPPRRPNLHPPPNTNKKRKPQVRKRRGRPPSNDPPPPPPDPPSPDAAVADPSPRPRIPWWLMVLIYIASTIGAVYITLELANHFFPERCEAMWDNLLQKWGIVEEYAHYQAQLWESAFDEAMTPKTTLRPPPSWGHNTALPPEVSAEVSVPKDSSLPPPILDILPLPQPAYPPAPSLTDFPDVPTVVIPPPVNPRIPAPVPPPVERRLSPCPRPVEPLNPLVTSLLAAAVAQELKDISGPTSLFHVPLSWVQGACLVAAGAVAIAIFVEERRRLAIRRSDPERISLQFADHEGEEEVEEETPYFTCSHVSRSSSKETRAADASGNLVLPLQGEELLQGEEPLQDEELLQDEEPLPDIELRGEDPPQGEEPLQDEEPLPNTELQGEDPPQGEELLQGEEPLPDTELQGENPLQGEESLPDTEDNLEEDEEQEESSLLRAGGATTTLYQETEPTLFRHSTKPDSQLLPPTPTPLSIGRPKGSLTLPRVQVPAAPPLGPVQRLLGYLPPPPSKWRSPPEQEGRAQTKSAASKAHRPYISPLKWPSTSDAEGKDEVEESIMQLDILTKSPTPPESQAPLEDVNKPKEGSQVPMVVEKDNTRKGRAQIRSAAPKTRRRLPYISPLRWPSTSNAEKDACVPSVSDPVQTRFQSVPPTPAPLPSTKGETERPPPSGPVQTVPDSPGLIAFFEELGLMRPPLSRSFPSTSTPQGERQRTKEASRPPPLPREVSMRLPPVSKRGGSPPTSGARWRDKNPTLPERIRALREVSMRPPLVSSKENGPPTSGARWRDKNPTPPKLTREVPMRHPPVVKEDDPLTSDPSGGPAPPKSIKEFKFPSRRTALEKDPPPRLRPNVNVRTKKADEHPSEPACLPEGASLESRREPSDDNRPQAAAKNADTIPPRQEVDVERPPADANANGGRYWRMSEVAFRSNILAFMNMRPEDRPASSWNLFQPREGGVQRKRYDEDDGDSMVANRSTNPPRFGDEIQDEIGQGEDEMAIPTLVSMQSLQDMPVEREELMDERQKDERPKEKSIQYHPSGLAALAAVDRLLADIHVRTKQVEDDVVRRAASLASYKEVLTEIDELAVVIEDMKKCEAASRAHLPPPLPIPVLTMKPSPAPVAAQRRDRRAAVIESTPLVGLSTASLPPASTPLPTPVDTPPAPLVGPIPQENVPVLESASLPELTVPPQPLKFVISPPSPITALRGEDYASADLALPVVPQYNATRPRRISKLGPDIRPMRGTKRGRDPDELTYRPGSPEAIVALSPSRPDIPITLVPLRLPSVRLSPSDRVPHPGMQTTNRGSVTGTGSSKKKFDCIDLESIDVIKERMELQMRGIIARIDDMMTTRNRPQDETRTVVEEREIKLETTNKDSKEKGKGKVEVTAKVEIGGSSNRGTGQEVMKTTRIQNAEASSSKAHY